MSEGPRFHRVLTWTVGPIAAVYATFVALNAIANQPHWRMMLNNLIFLLVPAAGFTFLVGVAAFLPNMITGPRRASWLGFWIGHFALAMLLSVVIMVLAAITTFVLLSARSL